MKKIDEGYALFVRSRTYPDGWISKIVPMSGYSSKTQAINDLKLHRNALKLNEEFFGFKLIPIVIYRR